MRRDEMLDALAQRLYLEQVCPRERADIVVWNADPSNPALLVVRAE